MEDYQRRLKCSLLCRQLPEQFCYELRLLVDVDGIADVSRGELVRIATVDDKTAATEPRHRVSQLRHKQPSAVKLKEEILMSIAYVNQFS